MALGFNIPTDTGSNSVIESVPSSGIVNVGGSTKRTYLVTQDATFNVANGASSGWIMVILKAGRQTAPRQSASTTFGGSTMSSDAPGGTSSSVRVTISVSNNDTINTGGDAVDGKQGKDLYVDLVDGTTGYIVFDCQSGNVQIFLANNVTFSAQA